jgi:hypothetical protein
MIVLGLVVVVAVVGLGAFLLLGGDDDDGGSASGPEGVVTEFVSALGSGDCDRAGSLASEELRPYLICSPDPTEIISLSTTEQDEQEAIVDGDFRSEQEGEFSARFWLVNEGGSFLVDDMEEGSFDSGEETAMPETTAGGDDSGVGDLPEPGEPLDDGNVETGPSSGPGGSSGGGAAPGPPGPIPSGSVDDCGSLNPDCEQYLQPCHDGDMVACDDLYWSTGIDNPYETYGFTCGGRSQERMSGQCEAIFGPQV